MTNNNPEPTRLHDSSVKLAEPAQLLGALGHVVVAFSEVELRVQQLIWYLLKVPDKNGQLVTSAMSFAQLVRLARRLWDEAGMTPLELDADAQATYGAKTPFEWVFRRIPEVEQRRNILMYSWWPDAEEPHWLPHITPPFKEDGKAIRWKSSIRDGHLQASVEEVSGIEGEAKEMEEVAAGVAFMAGMALAHTDPPA